MNKNRSRETGKLIFKIRLLSPKIKEWEKVLNFLKKRKGINEGRDKLIKIASFERNKIKEDIQKLIKTSKR